MFDSWKFIFVVVLVIKHTHIYIYRYIPPEQLQGDYGGLKKDKDEEFSPDDKVLEATLKPSIITTVKIPAKEVNT